MKNTLLKVWGIVLTLAILSGLLMAAVPVSAADLAWTKTSVPSVQSATANGMLLGQLVNGWIFDVAKNGTTMLAYDQTNRRLYKSLDAGATFTYNTSTTPNGLDNLTVTAMSIAPDSTTVVATDGTNVMASTDTGASWAIVTPSGFAGLIASVDITTGPTILVGTTDGRYAIYKASGAFGGGWTIYPTVANPPPVLTTIGKVIGAFFSPNYATDTLIVLVTNDGVNTYVRFSVNNRPLGEQYADKRLNVADTSATLGFVAFPSDFDTSSNANILVGVNSTGVWKVAMTGYSGSVSNVSTTNQLSATPVDSLSFKGTWAAGTAYYTNTGSATVNRITAISGLTNLTVSASTSLRVTGSSGIVVASPTVDNTVYVLTTGTSGALNVSADGGASFVQTRLIYLNGTLSIDDVKFVDANKIFLITHDTTNGSIYASTDAGATWKRLQNSGPTAYTKLYVSPAYATDSTLYITTPTTNVFKSVNGGASLTSFVANTNVVAMAIVDANTFFYVGTDGKVYKSSALYTPISVGTLNAYSIAYVSPTLMYVGTTTGAVYKSVDGGATYAAVGSSSPFTGAVVVAADATSLYAGSATPGEGVKKYSTTTSAWSVYGAGSGSPLANFLPTTAVISAISLNANGVVYVADTGTGKIYRNADGINWEDLQFVSATNLIAPTSLTLVGGVIYGNSTGVVYNYNDTLGVIPAFTSPGTGPAALMDTRTAVLSWAGVPGATGYTYKISMNSDMSSPSSGTTANTSVFLGSGNTVMTLINGQTYYVTVQVNAPKMSKVSPITSFQTQLTNVGTDLTNLMAPVAGQLTSTTPSFAWSAVANATSYEIKISDKSDFSIILDSAIGLTGTVYSTPTQLKPGVSYYWEVRAVKGTNTSAWVQSTFTVATPTTPGATGPAATYPTPINNITVTAPAATSAPQPTPNVTVNVPTPAAQVQPTYTINVPTTPMDNSTPAWAWIVIAIGAVLVIAVIVLIVRTRRV